MTKKSSKYRGTWKLGNQKTRTEDLEKKVKEEAKESFHVHLGYFGSELACNKCNPNCYMNHAFLMNIHACDSPKCSLRSP